MAKIVGYNNEGYKIVSEGDFCEHWEPEHGTLVPMKECWCCKLSDFRSNLNNCKSESVCRYEGNRCNIAQNDRVENNN